MIRVGMLAARPVWQCALFVNDVTPTPLMSYADFSLPHWPGFVPLNLTQWGLPYLNADDEAEIQAAPLTFRQEIPAAPPDTVYGYLVIDGSARLVWAERLSGTPTTMVLPGQEFLVQPRLELGQL